MGTQTERVWAVIPGAGESLRFARGAGPSFPGERKQFCLLGDQPLILVTLQPFIKSNRVHGVVLVVPEDAVERTSDLVGNCGFEKEVKVIAGGAERQDSVWHGLNAVSGMCDLAVVHDAVRPFFEEEWIGETLDLCSSFDGAIVAVRAGDTVKRVRNGTIKETLPRSEIWHAQTPQTFNMEALMPAFVQVRSAGILCTDEAQAVELNGGKVAVVEGSPQNIKITRWEDWAVAKSIWETLNRD